MFEICRHFVPPFALVSSRLDWSRDGGSRTLISLKPSDLVASFSIVENAREMRFSTLQNVADSKKNISMYKIPFFGGECLIKEESLKKDMDQFRVGEEKDVGAGEDVFFFKVQVIFIVNFLSSDI